MKYRTYKFPVNNGNEVARNSLFGAFIQLMDQKPINQITVLELCQKANISRSAFYWNFSSKENMLRKRKNWIELAWIHPHKLRHTFSTLARQGGATMEQISESLTHSDVKTTRIYVNTPDIINPEVHRMFVNRLEKERLKKTRKSLKIDPKTRTNFVPIWP